ncbi:MAG: tripartite tricarboxylate transporter substrate binding protein [Burkholderiales bacterium]|jgi:tripartite-type tricarboxylate transporter receptor subunit TctC|nr:tripartite tricarboxylate transporter substrate binding protein [Burkholderiales bacterium]
MNSHLRFCALFAFGAALFVPAGLVSAQQYPLRPVRVVVPFPPGGISDGLARVIVQHLSTTQGQQFVVDNRPGAGTTLAAAQVAKSPADGYTLYFTDVTTHAINASLYSRLPFDSVQDFSQVSMVAQTPLILIVHPSLPVKSVAELVALAKARPDEINYASSGNGTILHLSGETLKSMAKVKMVHIPYKGSAPAVAAVLGGEASISFSTTPAALPHIKAGKLRALGVTSMSRSPVVPEVPAMTETLKGFDIVLYSGMMGPAGMPGDVVAQLNGEIGKMLALQKVRDIWTGYGAAPVMMTPAKFTEHLRSDIAKLGKLVKAAGATID